MGPPGKAAWLKRNTGSSRLTGSGCSGPRNRLSCYNRLPSLGRIRLVSAVCYSDAVPFRATLSPGCSLQRPAPADGLSSVSLAPDSPPSALGGVAPFPHSPRRGGLDAVTSDLVAVCQGLFLSYTTHHHLHPRPTPSLQRD